MDREIKLKGDKVISNTINKDKALVSIWTKIYGTFAEIGAGQETVRHFLDLVVHLEL
jgi:hypothetical protein